MIFIHALDTGITSLVAKGAVGNVAGIFLTDGDGFAWGGLQCVSILALGAFVGESSFAGFAVVNGADLIALFPAVWFCVSILADWAIFGQVGFVAVGYSGCDTFVAVEIEGHSVVAFCADVLGLWAGLAVLLVASHHAGVFLQGVAALAWETLALSVAWSTVLNFALVFNAAQGWVCISQDKARLAFWAGFVVLAQLAIGNFAVVLAGEVGCDFVSIVTGLASSVDDRFTICDDRQFADLFWEIQGVSINTGLAISNVVFAFCTIFVIAFNTFVGAVLVRHKVSWLAFWAKVILDTNLAIFDTTLLVVGLVSSQDDLAADTAVVFGISWDVPVPLESPVGAPRVLDDPLGFGVTHQ